LLSVLAIVAGVFIPRWHDAHKRRLAADQFLVLAKLLLEQIESLHESVKSPSGRRGIAMFGHRADWSFLSNAAMELELDVLPDPSYLPVWLRIREIATRVDEYYQAVIEHGDNPDELWDDEGLLNSHLGRATYLYNQLVRLDIEFRGDRGYAERVAER